MTTIQQRIDLQWSILESSTNQGIDWLELEQLLRDILKASAYRSDIGDRQNRPLDYLTAIDEALAAHTGRGTELREANLDAPLNTNGDPATSDTVCANHHRYGCGACC